MDGRMVHKTRTRIGLPRVASWVSPVHRTRFLFSSLPFSHPLTLTLLRLDSKKKKKKKQEEGRQGDAEKTNLRNKISSSKKGTARRQATTCSEKWLLLLLLLLLLADGFESSRVEFSSVGRCVGREKKEREMDLFFLFILLIAACLSACLYAA